VTDVDSDMNHGISVKLSAFILVTSRQKDTMLPVSSTPLSLALAARDARIGLNIDAEESDRLDLSLGSSSRSCRILGLPIEGNGSWFRL